MPKDILPQTAPERAAKRGSLAPDRDVVMGGHGFTAENSCKRAFALRQ